ncbi:MAG: bacteriophage holin [Deltaproteobacteria bacterium]|uniref:Bacteriophage holin n=1 Tax=Candidatus Zymogenus saltonus TaxID=2844893 RepID=A0A9D8KF91_9DELT|nr:bacteriophage holin [Candidatus Zymogenus saltonus]
MKLNVRAFALMCAIVWAAAVLLYTWWIIILEGATGEITMIGRIYIGYKISVTGSLIGAAWGFFDGLIGGFIIAWLYNLLTDKMPTVKKG